MKPKARRRPILAQGCASICNNPLTISKPLGLGTLGLGTQDSLGELGLVPQDPRGLSLTTQTVISSLALAEGTHCGRCRLLRGGYGRALPALKRFSKGHQDSA